MTQPKPNKTPPNVPISYINNSHTNKPNSSFSGQNVHFLNPPDPEIPDTATLPATLWEQWKFAIRQYSLWYSPAWGTILAGVSFCAFIKGGNPLPSSGRHDDSPPLPSPDKPDEA